MADFRVGYLYSLAPIHCGGEGDLGNILEIAREVHTNFPYIPGSSLRGGLREEVQQSISKESADRLFGKELEDGNQMGVHQVWFSDARLLWVPMRTMSLQGNDVFLWVSCPSLLRDHALLAKRSFEVFPDYAVGDRAGTYTVADAEIQVTAFSNTQKQMIELAGKWADSLATAVKPTWSTCRIVLPDSDFQVLMEHSLWTQVRNKIDEDVGAAQIFWTDICIPRDTILYYAWGYSLHKQHPITSQDHEGLTTILSGLLQVGGQANIGRGWVQSWIADQSSPVSNERTSVDMEN
ncbi:type III-B CRISPR module RAMP protein Cmr4 [Leptolyngbya sp. NK1-12]|uniref:Type III-B CRISPR module RAMP protein Cmr4 n=1 Tax=Leptolyngbya sp. NK1-12 TaxID=2547451 RepID=A0AA96WUY5_9CYAN|nr:type III-B CRISPR module RAMP protein Cmr4 [Leptolyngbya sp. NK1-12]WNZ23862.1 type III-B CRISPR module RAMP protein Cmr4 [Leptolyngbya sp. NK1-12]